MIALQLKNAYVSEMQKEEREEREKKIGMWNRFVPLKRIEIAMWMASVVVVCVYAKGKNYIFFRSRCADLTKSNTSLYCAHVPYLLTKNRMQWAHISLWFMLLITKYTIQRCSIATPVYINTFVKHITAKKMAIVKMIRSAFIFPYHFGASQRTHTHERKYEHIEHTANSA